jgi:hypothetical protein
MLSPISIKRQTSNADVVEAVAAVKKQIVRAAYEVKI